MRSRCQQCCTLFVLGTAMFLSASARAYDFAELTALAEGALVGENVGQSVPGFEIRILKEGELPGE